jgi:hypothetical protein
LTAQLGINQGTRDFEPDSVAEREGLSAAQTCITGRGWAGYERELSCTAQHQERRIHVREPLQGTQSREAVLRNANQTLKPVPYTGEPDLSAIQAHAVFDCEMPGLHAQAYTETM